jgi:hypothetical protein
MISGVNEGGSCMKIKKLFCSRGCKSARKERYRRADKQL